MVERSQWWDWGVPDNLNSLIFLIIVIVVAIITCICVPQMQFLERQKFGWHSTAFGLLPNVPVRDDDDYESGLLLLPGPPKVTTCQQKTLLSPRLAQVEGSWEAASEKMVRE